MSPEPQPTESPRRLSDSTTAYRPWPHRLAIAAAVLTWPILLLGGTVTVLRAGMAVPDWPTTFGINMFLYNMFETSWAVFVEHGHRLYGSGLGLACVALACWFTIDRLGWRALGIIAVVLPALGVAVGGPVGALYGRPLASVFAISAIGTGALLLSAWFGLVRRDAPLGLAWLALAAVVGQGALGGLRVLWNAADLAFVHGFTAQAVFALMVVLAVVTGRRWIESGPRRPDPARLRRLTALTAALIYAQIVAGAYTRHFLTTAALIVHALLAVAVVAHAVLLAIRVEHRRAALPGLVPSVRALVLFTILQVGLGVANWWAHPPFDGLARPADLTKGQALIRLGHQGLGALLLAAAVVLTLRSYRLLWPASQPVEAPEFPPTMAPARRDLEPIA